MRLNCDSTSTVGTQIHPSTQIYKLSEAPRPHPLAIARWDEDVQNPPYSRNTSDTRSPLRILIFGLPRDSVSYDRQDGGLRSRCCRWSFGSGIHWTQHPSLP